MTYEEFEQQYRAFIASLPGTVNLPQGYMQNCRMWDYWMLEQRQAFQPGAWVLDTGALHTFGCVFWQQTQPIILIASDNFSWAARDYAKGLMTSWEWRCVVEKLGGLRTEPVDVQAIDPTIVPLGGFDVVLSISTIEHVHEDRQAMLEMYRVLKPGGKLLITSEYDEERGKEYSEEDGSFYRVYNQETWSELLAPYPVTYQETDVWRGPHWFRTIFACIEKPLE